MKLMRRWNQKQLEPFFSTTVASLPINEGVCFMAAPGSATQAPQATIHSGAKKAVADDVDALRSDIASLANSVGKLATETVGSTVGDVQAKAGATLGGLEAAIRKNPTQSAMVAVGVGFLFGLLVTR
jgi:ElaB/YqjD/DUF883 family membrane-anchored ribosome-binding protein